ncbi:MAG: hypothetical protein LC750_00495 [Actinobacteria bacterium]|nr:hypothetical protein [Actinomycetota bacterium]
MVDFTFLDDIARFQRAMFDTGLSGTNAALGKRVDKAAATLPATGNQTIFTIAGGNVMVPLLYGVVTTVIQAQANNLKVTSAPTTGTAVDLAANLDVNAKEAGTLLLVEGDGTALVGANAGAALNAIGTGCMIIPPGVIRITTSATNTGATRWQCWWMPLDSGATVVSG